MIESTQKTQVIKRSVRIAGHPTSISLEGAFWEALKEIAATRGLSLNALIGEIDGTRTAGGNSGGGNSGGGNSGGLSTAVPVHVLDEPAMDALRSGKDGTPP